MLPLEKMLNSSSLILKLVFMSFISFVEVRLKGDVLHQLWSEKSEKRIPERLKNDVLILRQAWMLDVSPLPFSAWSYSPGFS